MLIIFCGEDTVASRDKFIEFKQGKASEGYEIASLNSLESIADIDKLIGSVGLFNDKKVICGEQVLKDKKTRDTLKDYQNAGVDIVLHESSLGERELKFVYPSAKFVNSKLGSNVFTLLDSLTPGSLRSSHKYLQDNISGDNELLIFYLVKSRIRELILVKENMMEKSSLKAWQVGKLKSQASSWSTDKLTSCYNNLFKIEKNIKTSGSTFSVRQSLEMLFCFYL